MTEPTKKWPRALNQFVSYSECEKCGSQEHHKAEYMYAQTCIKCGQIFAINGQHSPVTRSCSQEPRSFLFRPDCKEAEKREWIQRKCNRCGFEWRETVKGSF